MRERWIISDPNVMMGKPVVRDSLALDADGKGSDLEWDKPGCGYWFTRAPVVAVGPARWPAWLGTKAGLVRPQAAST
jgi:hypothetical protein